MEDYKRKKKKKRRRSKLFRSCFPSFAADERPFSYTKADRQNTNNGRLGKPLLIAVTGRKGEDQFNTDVNLVKSGVTGSGDDCYTRRFSRRRYISRLLRAVLIDSLMVKKIRMSSSKSSIAADTSESFLSIENIGKSTDDSNATDTEDSSRSISLISSSSSSSTIANPSEPKTSSRTDSTNFQHSISSNSSTTEKRITSSSLDLTNSRNSVSSNSRPAQKLNSYKIKSACNNWNIQLYLFLLLSLVVLMIYGRIYSILCTSTWFYFLPCRRIKRVNSVANATTFLDTDSYQYKKRVIMAGLLDRARNPLR